LLALPAINPSTSSSRGESVSSIGSYRLSALSLAFFFLAGLAVLARVDVGRAVAEAVGGE
jgi:hypothetical protein